MKGPDHPNHAKVFRDETTGALARITTDELLVYTSAETPITYRYPLVRYPLVRYPLEKIGRVRTMKLTEGWTEIALSISGELTSSGLTFSDERMAIDFEQSLRAAVNEGKS